MNNSIEKAVKRWQKTKQNVDLFNPTFPHFLDEGTLTYVLQCLLTTFHSTLSYKSFSRGYF